MTEIICAIAGMALGSGLMALGYALGRIDPGGPCCAPAQREPGAAKPPAAPGRGPGPENGEALNRKTGPTPGGICPDRLAEGEEPDPAGPRAKALERLEADQRAFSALMGYSADVAYGLIKSPLREE